MEGAKYEEVTGMLSRFDPFDVFEIGKHFKPEFVSCSFVFKDTEFTVEIPFDMLEFMLAKDGSKDEIPKIVTTPKGTIATLNGYLVLGTRFMVNGAEYISLVGVLEERIDFRVYEDKPGNSDFIVDERIVGFSLSEPRIAEISFWYYEDGDDALFEGDGKGSIRIMNFTKEGRSITGPCDVSSREEAVEIANQSFVYRLVRRIAYYF